MAILLPSAGRPVTPPFWLFSRLYLLTGFYCPHRQRIFGLRKITLYTSDITGQTEFPTSETVRYKPYVTFTPESLEISSNSEQGCSPLFTGGNINQCLCYLSILQNWRYPIR